MKIIHKNAGDITITKILNGYLVKTYYDKELISFHENWLDIIKYIDGVYGEIERALIKIREEKTKKQVREETRPTVKES